MCVTDSTRNRYTKFLSSSICYKVRCSLYFGGTSVGLPGPTLKLPNKFTIPIAQNSSTFYINIVITCLPIATPTVTTRPDLFLLHSRSSLLLFLIYLYTVACRAVTKQRPRDKQMYQSRF
jgi:hypothetical protein